MENKFELMAPAGSYPALVAACESGADAIYIGLDFLSMRAGKRNFKVFDLDKIRVICNSYPRKPKIYVTLNTIVYDTEIKKLDNLLKKIKGKVDAVICWDFAVINLCKKYKIPFFISTQASVANSEAARFYKSLGAKRIVLARELNLKQIKEISKVKIDLEVFVHGAMCVSISGRCFTSQFLFNKSANRGECLHPCRRSYTIKDDSTGNELKLDNNRVMSAKDLCVLPFMEDLKKIGIKSFKIEGRNRDPRYVNTVVKVYRQAIDGKSNIKESMKELDSVYNRGFSSGFYLGKPTPKDFSEVEHSAATVHKEFLGNVVHIYPKISVAILNIKKELKIGDNVMFIHNKLGVKDFEITEMEIEGKKIKKATKGSEVAIKVPFKLFNNAEVYKICTKMLE